MLHNSTNKHLYYIDFVRVFLTILVFYHHSAIAFGASGGWFYKVKDSFSDIQSVVMSINMGIDQSYFMSLFFFISAFLMPRSYDKKGTMLFLNDRLNRLVAPLLIYAFIINPLLVYWIYGAPWEFGFGPMWFVFTLILFELSYVVYRTLLNKRLKLTWKLPRIIPTICFIILMGISAFIVRLFIPVGKEVFGLQIGFYPLYIVMYYLGIVAYRNNWLDQLKMKNGYLWIAFAFLVITPAFLFILKDCKDWNLLNGGTNLFAGAYAFWESALCVAISYFLLVFSKTYLNKKFKFVDWLSSNSYAFYIIHPLILVGCTFISESLPITPFQRFLFVFLVGVPLCFIAGNLFKRIMRIFNLNV